MQRAGVAFIAIAFIIAQIGTNIAANSISAGCDLTSLAPRFITIRRGGYVAATVGFAMLPWRLLSSSNNFATYLSAYSVFLSRCECATHAQLLANTGFQHHRLHAGSILRD